MSKVAKGVKVVKEVKEQAKPIERENKTHFTAILSNSFPGKLDEHIGRNLNHINDKFMNGFAPRKNQNFYFIEILGKQSEGFSLIDFVGQKLDDIENKVSAISKARPIGNFQLQTEISKLTLTIKKCKQKSLTEILLSPASRRRLDKINDDKKIKQSKSLLKKLHVNYDKFHHEYEEMIEKSFVKRSNKFEESAKKKEDEDRQLHQSLNEKSNKKYERSKSQKKENKVLALKAKMKLRKFLDEKPVYVKFQEEYELRNERNKEAVFQKKREYQLSHSMNRDRQREHELKISQMLKRREILHNSLKNLKPILPAPDPVKLALKEKMNRIQNFSKLVKENYLPEVDPKLVEATEKTNEILARRYKISDEVLQKMDENIGKGNEYLRKVGRIHLSAMSKTRNTLNTQTDIKMTTMDSRSMKPRPEIPHFKTKFDDMNIDEIIDKIDNHEIDEKHYGQLISQIDHAKHPHVIRKLAGKLKMGHGENVQMEFLISSMKAKLKILNNLS
jgi:hypothetical protein